MVTLLMVGKLVCRPVLKSHALLCALQCECWKDLSLEFAGQAAMPDRGCGPGSPQMSNVEGEDVCT